MNNELDKIIQYLSILDKKTGYGFNSLELYSDGSFSFLDETGSDFLGGDDIFEFVKNIESEDEL